MNPRITVIIPVYNGEKFIEKALHSVFIQNYPAHEVIVINDGSTDSSDEILSRMNGKILYKSIPNGGVSSARNAGIRMATGDYLAFLDADDVWFRNKLLVNAELIKAYPSVGCIFSDYIERLSYFGDRLVRHSEMVGHKNKLLFDRPLPFHPLDLFLFYDYASTPSAVVVRKGLAESVGLFDEKRKLLEDLDFYLRIALNSQMILSSKTLLYKYNHPNSMSSDKSGMFEARIAVIRNFYENHKNFLDRHGFKRGVSRSVARVYYMIGDLRFERGNIRGTFSTYFEALRHNFYFRSSVFYLSKNIKKIVRFLMFWRTTRLPVKNDAKLHSRVPLARRQVIVSVPAADNENPYQELFYGALEKKGVYLQRDFRIFSFVNIWKNRGSMDIVHIHWSPAPDSYIKGFIDIFEFWLKLLLCKLSNAKIIWTAHNLMPHDTRNIPVQYLKRLMLVRMADLIIVHFEGAKKQLRDKFFITEKKMVRMFHGIYEGVYPNDIDRESARKALSLPNDMIVFLFFGAIRRYKNIESLIKTFKSLGHPNALLLIAGKAMNEAYQQELLQLADGDPNIHCHFGYVSTEDTQIFFNSADCVVLPYKNIFTSGAAMLALTFKKPILMKRCDFSEEYLRPENSILMEECNEENLKTAIRSFVKKKESLTVRDDFLKLYRWPVIIDELMSEAASIWRVRGTRV